NADHTECESGVERRATSATTRSATARETGPPGAEHRFRPARGTRLPEGCTARWEWLKGDFRLLDGQLEDASRTNTFTPFRESAQEAVLARRRVRCYRGPIRAWKPCRRETLRSSPRHSPCSAGGPARGSRCSWPWAAVPRRP